MVVKLPLILVVYVDVVVDRLVVMLVTVEVV